MLLCFYLKTLICITISVFFANIEIFCVPSVPNRSHGAEHADPWGLTKFFLGANHRYKQVYYAEKQQNTPKGKILHIYVFSDFGVIQCYVYSSQRVNTICFVVDDCGHTMVFRYR